MTRTASPYLAEVIGFPLGHTLSPAIFKVLAQETGVQLRYSKKELSSQEVENYLSATAHLPHYKGMNVTLPYKKEILNYLDHVSEEAKAIGAVNVVSKRERSWTGHNTDVYGIEQTLKEQRYETIGKTGVILGSGGAAQAAAYALGKGQMERVWILARSIEKASALAHKMRNQFPKTDFIPRSFPRTTRKERSWDEASLFIQATSLGMTGFPQADFSFLFSERTPKKALAFDLVYKPLKTRFLHTAQNHGIRVIGGIDMLIWQALGSFELWFGILEFKEKLKKIIKVQLELQ